MNSSIVISSFGRGLNWFRCRDDEDLRVFFGDLERSIEFFIEEGQLKIILATNSGIMYFRKR